jgi:hypothetical protein
MQATMLSLDDYISKAHHLVPAPQILPQLLPLLNQPDIDSAKVVELISYNQSLTANVLRICNSAYYSRGTSIDNLQDAVTRVGFRQIYDIVVCIISSVTLARPQKGYGVEANALWDHSVTSALAAQVIAQEAQVVIVAPPSLESVTMFRTSASVRRSNARNCTSSSLRWGQYSLMTSWGAMTRNASFWSLFT